MELLNLNAFSQLVTSSRPAAEAILRGNDSQPGLSGTVRFYAAASGTLVVAEVFGLPTHIVENGTAKQAGPFYAFHIHEGSGCGQGSGSDPFAESGAHYNPANRPHPMHAGDMPPLLGDSGYAYLAFYTGRFTPAQIIGRSVVIHSHSDDFKTQPSGGAGLKLACATIKAYEID